MKIERSSRRASVKQLDKSVSQCLAKVTGAYLAASPPLFNLPMFKHLHPIPRLKRVCMADANNEDTEGEQ